MTEHLASTQPAIQRDNGGDREVFGAGATQLFETGALCLTSDGVGVLPAGVSAQEHKGTVHKTLITLANFPVNTTDTPSTSGDGSSKIYTFPRGLIQLLGAVCNLAIACAAGITSTASVVGSVGSAAAAADSTLTSTEADLIPSTAATLTASAGVMKGQGTTGKFFDNTTNTNSTQLAANLNFAIPDAGSSANSVITVNGTITLTWINHGDQ